MFAYIEDDVLVYRLAVGVSEILKGVRNIGPLRGRVLRDAGDAPTQEWIARVPEQHCPDDGLLSGETADSRERLDLKRVWIIDLLDGTREFASRRQDWAAHTALVEDGQPTHMAVGLPDRGQVFHTGETKAMQGPRADKVIVPHTRPPTVAKYVADKPSMELVEMGFAGTKAMHVPLGGFDAHIRGGDQYEWGSAAPIGIAKSTGLFANHLDGSAPAYNNIDTSLPDMLFCRPNLSEEILAAVKEFKDREQKQVSQGSYDRLH